MPCHGTGVFENGAIAAQLNRDFIPVKLDREERPDVDRVYMTYVQARTGSGGWPLNVFLTPDLKPFFGGTYFLLRTVKAGAASPACSPPSPAPGAINAPI